MLKGFIDLVFEHGGRYYVLDHKSNALGGDDSAYHPQAVQTAVAAHRYDLQAVLYLVALHRLLRQRLPSYSPAHHLGGALCVFWRGLATPYRGVYALPAPVALIERLDAALSGHTAAEAV
jgi:exodeoxyribonuclease V beta subunit